MLAEESFSQLFAICFVLPQLCFLLVRSLETGLEGAVVILLDQGTRFRHDFFGRILGFAQKEVFFVLQGGHSAPLLHDLGPGALHLRLLSEIGLCRLNFAAPFFLLITENLFRN
jgi:hypothetical protein